MKMARKKKKIASHLVETKSFYSDLKWCIDNDWQVYIVPTIAKFCRIAIRKGGITTDGKPYKYIDGVKHTSQEFLGKIEYKNQNDAQRALPDVYKEIRKRYE